MKKFDRASGGEGAGRKKFSGDFKKKGSDFKKGGDFKKKSFGGPSKFGRDRDNGERPDMFKATCAECGHSCEVPFKPISGKPVLCSHCFANKQEGGNSGDRRERSDRPSARREDGGLKEELAAINEKLDQILESLNN